MHQPSLFSSLIWTVSDLTRYLRSLLESDPALQDVWVQGEISNLSQPRSGHVYFTLKDHGAALRCVMWRSEALRLRMTLQDGLAVEAHGTISIYEPGGQYQLYVDWIRARGEGELYLEFLRRKERLEAEGLFDAARKRPVPRLPRRIGVVTSPSGAALRDILSTLQRRLPLVEVVLAPSAVQGEEAVSQLVAALEALNRYQKPDVILLARGGGSMEDLWVFNDERVVRAVAASEAPVISGVGHQTDFTLVDFAADLRAPTPTAAAELATPITLNDLLATVAELQKRLRLAGERAIRERENALRLLESRLRLVSPFHRLQIEQQRLDELTRRLSVAVEEVLKKKKLQVEGLEEHLEALNPLAILSRGYAILLETESGRLITRLHQVRPGMRFRVQLSDGSFEAWAGEKGKEEVPG
ncbi:MAG: exodeoxyribonuclease VII large subunit [Chloroflexi bacterium]|jgi:exodeoxyribonuclease VII large subunit|nr:exodeoxyribonuclease VII large subunit [Chloroflexota bacterium]